MEILYQDEELVAIHKPSGVFVHPSALDRTAPSLLPQLRDHIGRWVYPVHRLDRATSGVLLFALSPETAARMGAKFQARQVAKSYLAVVRGHASTQGEISRPLESENGELQEAVTRFECLAQAQLPTSVGKYASVRCSLVRVRTDGGRRHQIRRHLRGVSHPLIGDTVYGEGRQNRFFRERFGVNRLLLHAESLAFDHPGDPPRSGRRIEIRAGLEGEFRSVVAALGWSEAAVLA